jgi:hypothetical protein
MPGFEPAPCAFRGSRDVHENIGLPFKRQNQTNGTSTQGCQMVYFQTRNPYLGKFWMVLQWKMLVSHMAIWSILCSFGIFVAF